MFGIVKKNKLLDIISTQDGKAVNLDEVPDPAFSQRMLGDGVAIIPTDNKVYAPIDGVIIQVYDTLHAYGIQSDDGLDILIHIGINTVELKSQGFTSLVNEGDRVKAGDAIAIADLDFIKSKGYEIYTPILITNIDEVRNISCAYGPVKSGETVVIKYEK